MSNSLSTDKVKQGYKDFLGSDGNEDECKICKAKSLHEFEYWRIIKNDYPYDKIADKHTMLVPKRHAKEIELVESEKKELFQLKSHDIINEYDYIIENTKKNISIIEHYHVHLVQTKDF